MASTRTITSAETRRLSHNTGPMSTITFTETSQCLQTVPLLSPVPPPTTTRQAKQLGLLRITHYSSTFIAEQGTDGAEDEVMVVYANGHTEEEYGYEEDEEEEEDVNDFYSPKGQDIYYDEDAGFTPHEFIHHPEEKSLPPVPTYTESQMAYYPHGIKRLPHFHPQKFSRRLRTLMDQRRKPRPLYLDIEPQQDYPPSPARPRSDSLFQSIVRMVYSGPRYSEVNQLGDEAAYQDVSFWRSIDQRVILIGVIGLLLLGLSITAWTLAILTA